MICVSTCPAIATRGEIGFRGGDQRHFAGLAARAALLGEGEDGGSGGRKSDGTVAGAAGVGEIEGGGGGAGASVSRRVPMSGE